MFVDDGGRQRGVEYLLNQQASDGGWHSATYGALRGGAAVSALVLDALSLGHDDFLRLARPAAERAVSFLMAGVRRRGCVACPDGSLDYPVYASALLLAADARWKELLAPPARKTLRQYLIDAQITRQRGFADDSPHLGGWDLGGMPHASGVTTGTNISTTAFALEALATLDSSPDQTRGDASATPTSGSALHTAARAWLARCQNLTSDGGFFYSPDPKSADNKGTADPPSADRPASYGTATCDGIRALRACGVRADDEPLQRALGWLGRQPAEQGIPGLGASDWSRAMSFYYLASMARSLPAQVAPEDVARHRRRILAHLTAEQRPDGSWSNPVARMREDDPLIATSLAVAAAADWR